jgi:hypothetical protein
VGPDATRARRFRLAASTCAALGALLLVAAIALNDHAIGAEDGIVPDDAFGSFVIGIVLAVAAGALGVRSGINLGAGSEQLVMALSLLMGFLSVLGAFLALGEPAVFNTGYGCLGRTEVWLAVAMRPTPAPCGYLIPTEDNSLFYPAALASFGAAAMGAGCAILTRAGRMRRST